jgi:hypothetical protein
MVAPLGIGQGGALERSPIMARPKRWRAAFHKGLILMHLCAREANKQPNRSSLRSINPAVRMLVDKLQYFDV